MAPLQVVMGSSTSAASVASAEEKWEGGSADDDASASTDDEPAEPVYTEGWDARFSDRKWNGFFDSKDISEVSGMAYSLTHKDIIYVVNDIQYDDDIYVVNATNGHLLNNIDVKYANNYDWEDLAVAPCDKGSSDFCIYIADTGRSTKYVYKAPEPKDPLRDSEIVSSKKWKVSSSQKSMEAIIVTPEADIYLLTEEKEPSLVNVKADRVETYKCGRYETAGYGPTGAAVSADGTMVLVKVEEDVLYYHVPNGNYIEVLCDKSNQQSLEYTPEYDGQAITFSPDGYSYYTCNEEIHSPLYLYVRLKVTER